MSTQGPRTWWIGEPDSVFEDGVVNDERLPVCTIHVIEYNAYLEAIKERDVLLSERENLLKELEFLNSKIP